ncbi:hypothetical protein JCGZ_21953 [Jatropha curcas]|uniref:HMA domain-containing protein n=1 Tax=Jatropha curcas TaxID=180498 RepID=A0A067JCE9_JATCU|nr:hypothetical protein JCGZ_21953 [Jatropha curcas]
MANNTQVCVLKMNINCEACEKKVKKFLQKIHGVHSVQIDANEGKVTISTTRDPEILAEELFKKAGKKAKVLSKQNSLVNNENLNNADGFEHVQLKQLEEFSKNPRLKQVEVAHIKKINMIFKDNNDADSSRTENNLPEPKPKVENGPANPADNAGPSQSSDGGGSGGSDSSHHDFEITCGGAGKGSCEEKAKKPLLPPNSPATVPQTPPSPPANPLYADVNCEHMSCTIM